MADEWKEYRRNGRGNRDRRGGRDGRGGRDRGNNHRDRDYRTPPQNESSSSRRPRGPRGPRSPRSPPTLCRACAEGDLQDALRFCEQATPDEIHRGLVVACKTGRDNVVMALLPKVGVDKQQVAFYEVCKHGHTNVFRAIMADPAYERLINEKKYQGFIFAVLYRHMEMAKAIPFDTASGLRLVAIERAVSIMLEERNFQSLDWMVRNREVDHQGICASAGIVAGYFVKYEDAEMAGYFAQLFEGDDVVTAAAGLLRRKSFHFPFLSWLKLLGFRVEDHLMKLLEMPGSIRAEDLRYFICGMDEPQIHEVMLALQPDVLMSHLSWLSLYVNILPYGVFDRLPLLNMYSDNVPIVQLMVRFGVDHVVDVVEHMPNSMEFFVSMIHHGPGAMERLPKRIIDEANALGKISPAVYSQALDLRHERSISSGESPVSNSAAD